MWVQLCLAFMVTLALFYVPGYFFFRGLRFDVASALCLAPLFGACAFALFPITYYTLGIRCNLPNVFGPSLAIALVVYFASRFPSRNNNVRETLVCFSQQRPLRLRSLELPFDAVAMASYLVFGIAICWFVFVNNLPQPDAFACRLDNQTHLNSIQSFLISGRWSSLHHSAYLETPLNAIPNESNTGGFYPSGLYDLVALICDALGVGVTLGLNATLVSICAVVLPLGSFAFLRALFPDDPLVVMLGPLAMLCFPSFPWNCLIGGPLYPNLYGMALLPAAVAWIIMLVEGHHVRTHVDRIAICSLVTLCALALAHPNVVFALYVFCAFFGIHVLWQAAMQSSPERGIKQVVCAILVVAVFAAAIVAIWYGLYHIPQLETIASYLPYKPLTDGQIEELLRSALGYVHRHMALLLVAAALCLGLMYLLRKHRQAMLYLPAVFFIVAYVATKLGFAPLAYWMGALWYSDSRRLAQCVALFAAPVLAAIFGGLVRIPLHAFKRHAPREARHTDTTKTASMEESIIRRSLACVLVLACSVAVIVLGYRGVRNDVRIAYGTKDVVFDAEEVAFMDRVKEVAQDDLVLNSPQDGSVWSYATNALNTYYRSVRTKGHGRNARLIRERLCEYAKDKSVREAVAKTGARYVVQLDHGVSYEDGTWLIQYKKDNMKAWKGIDSIDDKTRGFEVVLSEGDEMRLYRIKSLDDIE